MYLLQPSSDFGMAFRNFLEKTKIIARLSLEDTLIILASYKNVQ